VTLHLVDVREVADGGLRTHAPAPRAASSLPTNLGDLDRIGGLPTPGLGLITGEPGAEVTGFVLRLCLNVARIEGRPVVYVSDHHTPDDLTQRLASSAGRVALHDLRAPSRSDEQDEEVATAREELSQLPVLLASSRGGVTPLDLERAAVDAAERYGHRPALLVVDRADALHGGARRPGRPTIDPESERVDLAAALRDIAEQHGCAILVTETTFSEPRSIAEPVRPDEVSSLFCTFRDDLEFLWHVHRDELRDPDTPKRGIGDLHIAWQRKGPIGVARLAYLAHLATWAALARRTDSRV
jgi:replicative DNA helicase